VATFLGIAEDDIYVELIPNGGAFGGKEDMSVQAQTALLARLTGRPVIPLAFACSRGHRFGSWDRFLLPYPFGRAVFCYGPPLRIAPGEDRTAFGERLQAAMEENDRRAQAHLEEHGVSAV
jgi:lysophospholipid acyltransferase (LPLAT)-like uncharacterized protein